MRWALTSTVHVYSVYTMVSFDAEHVLVVSAEQPLSAVLEFLRTVLNAFACDNPKISVDVASQSLVYGAAV
jgi:hypothetical protein